MKLLLKFPNALFHGVDEGSILGDDEVLSSQARWTVPNCHNFRSDRWIAIMRSGRDMLGGRFERAITFKPTVASQ